MDKDSLERDLAAANAEIDRIDRAMHELARRRTLVEDYAASCARLLGALDEAALGDGAGSATFLPPMSGRMSLPPPSSPPTRRPSGGRGNLSLARRYWGEVVYEAMSIIEREGHPLTAAEIHALHSQRGQLTPEDIYDALYKRARRRRFVESLGGRFWSINAPRL